MADNSPIIIRKVVEEGGHGHHGGAWKVAYADFVTAMMAFFLMLWLLATADQQQLKGLAEFFSETDANGGEPGGAGGVLSGITIATDDLSIQMPMSPFAPAVPPLTASPRELDPDVFTLDLAAEYGEANGLELELRGELDDEAFAAERRRREQAAFDAAKDAILQALTETPELAGFTDSLLIDDTPEGLRIQLIDREQSAMFPTASAELYPGARNLIGLVARSIEALPNQLSIRGHTDSRPFAPGARYDNWRLSSDRAHATREALVAAGVRPRRIADVMGKADAEPLFPEDPADPRNRRISVVMLRHAAPTIGPTAATTPP
jgi:chemotaxis protein MotB